MHRLVRRPNVGGAFLRPEHGPTDRGWPRLLEAAAVVGAFGVGVIGTITGPEQSFLYVMTTVGLPAVILGLMILARARGPRLLAGLALGLEGILAGLFVPAGLAFAVVLPLIGLALVQTAARGRLLLAGFGAAGAASVVGVCAAVSVGPAHILFSVPMAIMTVVAFAAVVLFALVLDWRAIHRLLGALGSAERQIEARDRAEADLDRTSDILSAMVQSSPVATQAFALDRTVTIWNPASERLFGWTADEIIGRTLPHEMTPDDERSSSMARIQRTIGGATVEGDRVRRLTKSGAIRWIDIYAAPLRDRTGQPIGVVGQLVDVTDRVELEAQLIQAQKMEVVGLLASGLAHDFNNTLAAAGGFATLIEETSTDPEIQADAGAIRDVVERARQVSRQLLSFARGSDKSSRPVDVRLVVEGLLPLLRQLIGPEIRIDAELADKPMIARVDAGQLDQALINLAINARDAMPGGGSLTIAVNSAGRRRSSIEIAVRDSGSGIAPDIQARMFEPFFTTKELGRGSGLGLSMVRGFAAGAGGDIAVESTPGCGSTFSIRLPRVSEPRNAARARPPR